MPSWSEEGLSLPRTRDEGDQLQSHGGGANSFAAAWHLWAGAALGRREGNAQQAKLYVSHPSNLKAACIFSDAKSPNTSPSTGQVEEDSTRWLPRA